MSAGRAFSSKTGLSGQLPITCRSVPRVRPCIATGARAESSSQLFVLDFELANALLLHGRRLTSARLSELFGIDLRKPACDGRFGQFHVSADVADAEVVMTNYLHNLQLEASVKDSTFLFRRGDRSDDFHLSWCAMKLDQDKVLRDLPDLRVMCFRTGADISQAMTCLTICKATFSAPRRTHLHRSLSQPRKTSARTFTCTAGTTSASNQGLALSHMLLRGLGCGSGMTFGPCSRQARTVSVKLRVAALGMCHAMAYRPMTSVSAM